MKTIKTLLAAMAAALLVSPAPAAEPIVIKFSHVVTADAPKGKAAEHFRKLAEERTGGRVRVDVYPNSQLYKDKEEMEAVQLGAVQMLAPAFGKFGPLGVREFEIFDLPYLFDSMEEAKRITQGPIGKTLLKKLDSRGILGLAFWDNTFKQMTANKPLRLPEDYRGLKMRIQSSKVIDAQMRALGVLPQVMAFSELYQALQTGVVDGQENPFSNIYTQKMHEVQKHLTITNHGYHGYVVIVNKRFWEDLPPDIRTILEEAMAETSEHFTALARKDDEDALNAIRKSGKIQILVPTAAETAALKKALLPVHDQMKARFGEDLLVSINNELRH
jgi:C4-dicarboxylate-binding protein DctP